MADRIVDFRSADRSRLTLTRSAYQSSTGPTVTQASTVASAWGSAIRRAMTAGRVSIMAFADTSGQLPAFFHWAPLS
ncbi:hypothetical protein D3C77_624470 [compost metagenome]